MKIYCCQCQGNIKARLTTGIEIYPNRYDLSELPFWKCDVCKNYIGCHYKTKNRTQPLGSIPNSTIRNARKYIHTILDPLWKGKKGKRPQLYSKISETLGYEYHTGEIKDIEEARKIYVIVRDIANKQQINTLITGSI